MRYRIIDECLRSATKYWSVNALIKAIEKHDILVKRRTILYDIDNMKNDPRLAYFAKIEYCKSNKGYYYLNPNYSIQRLPLTPAEFQTLATSLSLLKFKDAFKDYEAVIDKLLRIGDEKTKNVDTSEIIEFEKAPYYSGEKYIDPLLQYVREKQPIELTYQKFGQDHPSKYIVHPYYLKEYRNRWYLLCYYEDAKEMRTFALDRMVSEPAEKIIEYIPCTLKQPSDYFKDIIGITLAKGPVEEVILSFHPTTAPYLKTQPLHHSQQIIKDDKEELQVLLKVIPNYELTSTILSYGNKVKVLGPVGLREEISSTLPYLDIRTK
jgi:predicted DNA-binding transcriptional regulator YafY